jgi:hypothetical protein
MIQIKGFFLLEIPLNSGAAQHLLYLKEHTEKDVPSGSALFVGNIDYGGNRTLQDLDEILRCLFDGFGEIVDISVSNFAEDGDLKEHEHRSAYDSWNEVDWDPEILPASTNHEKRSRFAHVFFSSPSAVEGILSARSRDFLELGRQVATKYGLAERGRLKSATLIASTFSLRGIDLNEVRTKINSDLEAHEKRETIERESRLHASEHADADGFITVVNNKKRNPTANIGKPSDRSSGTARKRAKKKNVELKNFYRFQKRDQRKSEIETLRKKFEEDTQKLKKMKLSQKFQVLS